MRWRSPPTCTVRYRGPTTKEYSGFNRSRVVGNKWSGSNGAGKERTNKQRKKGVKSRGLVK